MPPAGAVAASRFTLLESKLRVPRPRAGAVPRSSLANRLRTGRRPPIVVVEGPAGSGKTTLAADWAQRDRRPFAWYSIDETDDDPTVFLTYLAVALGRCGAAVDRARQRLASPRGTTETVANALARALASLPAPAVLVLDQLDALANPECLGALAALLDEVPAGSQLVLLTRAGLDLPLTDARTAGRVLDLAADDLRLSDAEAGALVRAAGLELEPDDVRTLNARCEGWATGLYLVALAGDSAFERLRDGADGGIDRFVGDFLRLEVLDPLDDVDRELLLQASVLDRLGGSLCDAALERSSSGERLDEIARSNLFLVRLDGEGGWFRLHPLLRELLHAELVRRDDGRAAAILERAADWHEAAGELEAAIECGIDAGDGDRVARLLGTGALPVFWSGRAATVERWLTAIDDPALLAAHPDLATFGAGFLAFFGRARAAERWASAALEGDPRRIMADGSPAEAWTAEVTAMLCRSGVEAMRDDAERAVRLLSEGSGLLSSAQLLLGFAYLLTGEVTRAEEAFAATIESARTLGATASASGALATSSLLAAGRGDLREAADRSRRAYEISEEARLDEYPTTAIVHVAGARVALAHGNRTHAKEALERADRAAARLNDSLPWLAVYVRLELAHLHLALGDVGRTRELLDEIEEVFARVAGFGVAVEQVARLRHDLDTGHSDDDGWDSPLTPAELRLLPLLAGHLSFREVADRLDISRNTVKTQAIAVYRKLDVSSRSKAVERAQELGLLRSEQARTD